jgi:hypothetical protein
MIEKYKEVEFELIEKIHKKIYNKKNNILYIDKLTENDKNNIEKAYKLIQGEIEDFNISNKVYTKDIYYKTLNAWNRLIFIKDKRTIKQVIANVCKGWEFEDKIFKEIKKLNMDIKYNGTDKSREHNLFKFNSTPDFLINKQKVELQSGNHAFFKQNKLNTAIRENGFILFHRVSNDTFYLFKPKDIKKINQTQEKIEYIYKKGKNFEFEDYKFTTLSEALKTSFLGQKKKQINNHK